MQNIPHFTSAPQTEMPVLVVSVTPEVAQAWLARNKHNRSMSAVRVMQLVAALERGEWTYNGETVKFSSTGDLIDGQHRLEAVRKSGITAKMLVAGGVSPSAMATIDVGAKRSFADILRINEIVPSQHDRLASAVTLLALTLGVGNREGSARGAMTHLQKSRVMEENPGLVGAVEPGNLCYKLTRLNESGAIVAYYKLTQVANKPKVDDFWEPLCTGEGLERGDPRLAIRKFAINPRRSVNSNTRRIEHFGAIIKAWNNWLDGNEMLIVKFGSEDPLKIEPLMPQGRTLTAS